MLTKKLITKLSKSWKVSEDTITLVLMEEIRNAASHAHKLRKEAGIPLKQPLASYSIIEKDYPLLHLLHYLESNA